MIGIKGIASYVPSESIDNVARAATFGETEDFLRNKIGALRLPHKTAEQETSDLAVCAVQILYAKYPELNNVAVEALIVVTQNPDGEGLPHTAAIVQHKLGLPETIAAFDVSLGCSGYVYGLFVLKGFMQASGFKNGILVTADPYSKIVDPANKVTSLLFGDAATATWVGDGADWEFKAVSYGTSGAGAGYLQKTDGLLSMNGRQVFNFALLHIAPHIMQILTKNGLKPDQIDLYCLHQGSAAIVDAIAKKFPGLEERFVKGIEQTGNTVSSSIPLLLEKHVFDTDAKIVVVSGFGVGLSWASAIISKSN